MEDPRPLSANPTRKNSKNRQRGYMVNIIGKVIQKVTTLKLEGLIVQMRLP